MFIWLIKNLPIYAMNTVLQNLYKTLFIYPDDIRNGFDGLMNKIEMIKYIF